MVVDMVVGMTKIIEKVKVKGTKKDPSGKFMEKELKVLFDSGAGNNLISPDIAEEFCDIIKIEFPEKTEFPKSITGELIHISGACQFTTELEDKKNQILVKLWDTVALSEDFKKDPDVDMIIGAPTMERFGIKLQFDYIENENYLDLTRARPRIILAKEDGIEDKKEYIRKAFKKAAEDCIKKLYGS
jgi:hypothetical protein